MIMMVESPGSQMGSPAAAEEGGEEMGGEKCDSGERSEVQARLDLSRNSSIPLLANRIYRFTSLAAYM